MKKVLLLLLSIFSISQYSKAQSQVTFYTNYGSFQAELYDSLSPITAGNFKTLVDTGFYDGIIFHRVVSNFVIQGGDPLGNGTGGPGYTIPDEFILGLSNIKQTLSMANAGPNTGGSQFFINLKNNTFLDFDKTPFTSAHPVFGIVRDGWLVVQTIETVPVNSNDKPITDVVMDSVRTTGSYLAIEEIDRMKSVTQVYPNPISNQSVLDVFSNDNALLEARLYTSSGTLTREISKFIAAGKTLIPMYEFNLNSLKNGVYFLVVKNGNSVFTERIVILK